VRLANDEDPRAAVRADCVFTGAQRDAHCASRFFPLGTADAVAQRLNCAIPELSVALPKAQENRGLPL
jgi:hypothetical protein